MSQIDPLTVAWGIRCSQSHQELDSRKGRLKSTDVFVFNLLNCLRGGFMCKFGCREFALIALTCCAAQFSVAQQAPVASLETEQHIQHVTSGLTGDVVVKGDDHTTHVLADRMKDLKIPGVSIAVIHE